MSSLRTTKILVVLVVVLVLLPATHPAQAGGIWSVWLFSYDDAPGGVSPQTRLLRVYEDGSYEERAFLVPEGASLQFPRFAFTDNGNWIAYCTTTPDPFHVDLHVIDLYAETDPMAEAYNVSLPFTYQLDTVANCLSLAFSTVLDEDNTVKLALIVQSNIRGNELPGEVPPLWEILVFNLQTGAIEHRLTTDSPAVGEYMAFPDADIHPPPMPELVRFDANVVFRLEPQGPERGVPKTPAYQWDTHTGTLTPSPQYGSLYTDVLARVDEIGQILGVETIRADIDGAFPITDEVDVMGTFTPYNVVVCSNDSGEAYPIFTWPGGVIGVTFIDSGRRIAINAPSYGWIALDRNSQLGGMPVGPTAGPLFGARDGYVFVDMDISMLATRLLYHRFVPTESGFAIEPTLLWLDSENHGWTLAWITPMPAFPGLEPFPAVTP